VWPSLLVLLGGGLPFRIQPRQNSHISAESAEICELKNWQSWRTHNIPTVRRIWTCDHANRYKTYALEAGSVTTLRGEKIGTEGSLRVRILARQKHQGVAEIWINMKVFSLLKRYVCVRKESNHKMLQNSDEMLKVQCVVYSLCLPPGGDKWQLTA